MIIVIFLTKIKLILQIYVFDTTLLICNISFIFTRKVTILRFL